jgi:hypothetical protein
MFLAADANRQFQFPESTDLHLRVKLHLYRGAAHHKRIEVAMTARSKRTRYAGRDAEEEFRSEYRPSRRRRTVMMRL